MIKLLKEMWRGLVYKKPDPDGEIVRSAYRAYDNRVNAADMNRWQVWRDAIKWYQSQI